MGSNTDTNNNGSSPTPSGVERVGFLDQWITRRIADAEAAEARLTRRLEHVAKAEQSLRALLDSLRGQVAEAFPLINQLSQFRQSAQATVNDVLGSSKSQFSQAVDLVRSRIEAMNQAERSLDRKLEDFDQRANLAIEQTRHTLAEALDKAQRQAGDLLDSMPKSVAARIEVFKQEVERTLALASRIVAQRTEQFEKSTGLFEDWLEEEIDRQKARQQHLADDTLQQFQEELELQTAPLAKQVREIQEAQKTLIDGGEANLQRRFQQVRHEIEAALESTQQLFTQRVAQMLGGARALVELHEAQLAGRVESLRPRAASAANALETELAARLAAMERQAEAALNRIEDHLMGRLEALVQRGRQVLMEKTEAPPPPPEPGFVALMQQLRQGRRQMRQTCNPPAGDATMLGDNENSSLAAPIAIEVFIDGSARNPASSSAAADQSSTV